MAGPYEDLPEDGDFTDDISDRIILFQHRVVTENAVPDGRIDPGGLTLAKLVENARDVPSDEIGPMLFPFFQKPSVSYKTGARYFRARRSGGTRWHAGCDLIFDPGVEVRAVADGRVIQSSYHFYSGTNALEVDHGHFIVRYGEIMPGSVPSNFNKKGAFIAAGEIIAKVGRLESGSSMLHFEMFSGSKSGTLSGTNKFRRRSDLLDCTDFLDMAVMDLGDAAPTPSPAAGAPILSSKKYVVAPEVTTRLRIRKKSDTGSDIEGLVGRGAIVGFLGMERGGKYQFQDILRDDWAKIRYGGITGYVAGAFIHETTSEDDAETEYYAVSELVENRLDLRETADISAPGLLSLAPNTVLRYVKELTGGSYMFEGQHRADWAEVGYQGTIGYVAAAYIEPFNIGQTSDGEVTEGGELNKILFEFEPAGASDATARQDKLPQRGIRGVAASNTMAKTDLKRVKAFRKLFLEVGIKHDLPPALLCAIASRETRGGSQLDDTGHGDGGHGFGIMQIDDRSWNADKSEGPGGLVHIDQAAGILAYKLKGTEQIPGLSDVEALATAISRYNGGRGLAFPRSDEGTTGADYMNDVWQRARYYAKKIGWT
ncbi:MAG: SH3 domain-containing protein [Pseudomonadota bacterium]